MVERPSEIAQDDTPVCDVIKHVKEVKGLQNVDIFVMYLTYPYRKKEHVFEAVEKYYEEKAKSLLCLEDTQTHPYLTVHRIGGTWVQTVKHNLYRRQDYPDCKEISHYMCIVNSEYVDALNKNLYNKHTLWYELHERVTDVDYLQDLKDTDLEKSLAIRKPVVDVKNIKNIILFGNDSSIKDVDLFKVKKLKDQGYTIVGVNRIWEYFYPDIWYFEDFEIIKEIYDKGVSNPSTTKILSGTKGYLRGQKKYPHEFNKICNKYNVVKLNPQALFNIHAIPLQHSIGMIIRYLNKFIFKSKTCHIYIYGVSLNFKKGHSWKEKNNNSMAPNVYQKRFNTMYNDIKNLSKEFSLFSIMEESRLNEFLDKVELDVRK